MWSLSRKQQVQQSEERRTHFSRFICLDQIYLMDCSISSRRYPALTLQVREGSRYTQTVYPKEEGSYATRQFKEPVAKT